MTTLDDLDKRLAGLEVRMAALETLSTIEKRLKSFEANSVLTVEALQLLMEASGIKQKLTEIAEKLASIPPPPMGHA